MLYNIEENERQTPVMCQECAYFDRANKLCKGFGKACFEADLQTGVIIDPVTRLPLRIIKLKGEQK